jgi:predicted cobalt transporter CbtA
MVRSLLLRGMLAGLIAGALGFAFAHFVGESSVAKAEAFESYVAQTHHEHHETEVVTRTVQASAGLGAGALVYGVAFGGLFALVFTIAYGRLGPLHARGTAALLGLLGFVAICIVPFLKYPANPPSVGQADTIGHRTQLFLLMMVLSVAAMIVAAVVQQRLVPRLGAWNSTLVVAGGYLAVILVCYLLLPGVNEVPQQAIRGVVPAVTDAGVTFPSRVLWHFRAASIGTQAVMWATLALAFGPLAQRVLERDPLAHESLAR